MRHIFERDLEHLFEKYKLILIENNLKIPFFNYLKKRYVESRKNSEDLKLCSKLIRCVEPAVEELKQEKTVAYAPKDLGTKDEHKHIKYFTHSEQYALFKMGNDNAQGFRDFLKCVQVQLGGQFQVDRCALLVYTSNVMCARCAHSVVIDFERSFQDVVCQELGLSDPPQQVFIAGYQTLYRSHLHDIPEDPFEQFMDRRPVHHSLLTPKNNDETYGYQKIIYSADPPLVYHYMISINEELRKAVSDQDIPQVKLLLSLGPSLRNRDQNKWTVLHIAAQQDNQALHQLLVAHLKRTTKPPNNWHDAFLVQNDYKDTAIHVAAYFNNFTLINVLVEAGFPLWIMNHVRGNGDNTPLHTAAARGHNSFIDAFLTLCERGFSPYDRATKNADGKTYQQM